MKEHPMSVVGAPQPVPDALDLAPTVGVNLRRLRSKRGLSLERLAQL